MTEPQAECRFAMLDGSYVLGSLAPAERAEFERHLAGCAECSRSVRELAGLPGLLSRVSPEVLDEVSRTEPVPETLLPALVKEVRRTQRTRVLRTAGLAAAAAAVVAGGSVVVVSALDDGNGPTVAATSPAPAPTTAPARPMQRVDEDVTGALSLTPVAWGTRLDLTCTYAASYARALDETFALFVRTADGQVEKVATWRGVIGREMRLTAATATDATDISSVVVRTTDGEPVLRLTE
jgi:hypothetical protein